MSDVPRFALTSTCQHGPIDSHLALFIVVPLQLKDVDGPHEEKEVEDPQEKDQRNHMDMDEERWHDDDGGNEQHHHGDKEHQDHQQK